MSMIGNQIGVIFTVDEAIRLKRYIDVIGEKDEGILAFLDGQRENKVIDVYDALWQVERDEQEDKK